MPIFEFTCKTCNNNFEELVIKSDEVISCPSCSSKDVGKLISKCRHSSGSTFGGDFSSQAMGKSSASSCSGCSGGNCSSCG